MSRRSSGEGSVFRKRDDLWGAHLTLPNGKRKYFYAITRKDVVEKLRIARIKMERGQSVDDDKRTVGEYLTWWLVDQRQHLAYETWRGYESSRDGVAWEEWGLVFTRKHGSPIWYSDANRHLGRKCLDAKVPKVTMHELRHSAPSILLTLGVDQRVIMRVLRHSTIVLTANLYTHVVDPLVTDAVNRIDRAFGGAKKDERFSEGVPEGTSLPTSLRVSARSKTPVTSEIRERRSF
jgi:integrase